ncbi:hypothetical protein RRG08_053650 [Elysia crispata]|uniref:ShKT domain-containing protein n=1 Tax=Elysia crispata TaxID=231223 RepID=A0AAE1DKL7_9GAST|nr:hypothetical protein RRG08_053650 [Elysia crispata]
MVPHLLQFLLLTALTSFLQAAPASTASDPIYNTYFSFETKGYRPGFPTETNSCQRVRKVPTILRSAKNMKPKGLAIFYQKYTEAYGIPVVSSKNVPDDALRRACYVLRFMLADNSVVRKWVYRMSGRIGVMGKDEGTNDIPEHSHLDDWWNDRARGLGGTHGSPVSTGAEENILCHKNDGYKREDILLHEFAHGIHILGAAVGIQGWDIRLRAAFDRANTTGLFKDTYFMENPQEYFAEGVQSYFNVQTYRAKPNGVHDLYNLIKEIFPCENTYLKRCESDRTQEDAQQLDMNCEPKGRNESAQLQDGTIRCKDNKPACEYYLGTEQCTKNPGYMKSECKKSCGFCNVDDNNKPDCFDEHKNCASWADIGECDANPNYMLVKCKYSCKVC